LLASDSLFHQEVVIGAPDLVLNGDGIACFDEDNANTPLRMRLNPNPARQRTNITFAVRAAGETCVEIYNMLGVRVAERNLGYREAGMHQEVLDLSALPQGLYAVRLRCGQHVCNGKVAVR
ncbi:MAG: T9SS type A sorting domain-containing protein, partial [Bacteroidales bacterium]|nr:T9SS type A sorting domain-containing protein [Bacteroidales bacterium]